VAAAGTCLCAKSMWVGVERVVVSVELYLLQVLVSRTAPRGGAVMACGRGCRGVPHSKPRPS
jgi:hypothetical protein